MYMSNQSKQSETKPKAAAHTEVQQAEYDPAEGSHELGSVIALQEQAGNTAVSQAIAPTIVQCKPQEAVGACPTCGRQGSGTCPDCGESFVPVQRKETAHSSTSPSNTSIKSLGNGQSLNHSVQSFFSNRFNFNFSNVRVHTNSKAADTARQLNARAYTFGNNIVFDKGQYDPYSIMGQGLLAHELAHVIQQQKIQTNQKMPVNGETAIVENSQTAFENEADQASDAILSGRQVRIGRRISKPILQRKRWGRCPPGKRLSGSHPFHYASAELYALGFYKAVRGRHLIISNSNLLEDIPAKGKHARMLSAMQDRFRSFKKPSPIRKTESVGDLPEVPVYPGQSSTEVLKGRKPKLQEGLSALLRPDIIDMDKREVYDVTTKKQSERKKAKVETYAKRLEAIRRTEGIPGKSWTAGKTLGRPTKITYLVTTKKIICFGYTNLSMRPGVISYEVILRQKKKKKKKKKRRETRKNNKRQNTKSRKNSPSRKGAPNKKGGSPLKKGAAPVKKGTTPKIRVGQISGAKPTKVPKVNVKVPKTAGRLNLKKIRIPKMRFGGVKGGHILIIIGTLALEYFIGEAIAEQEAKELEEKIKQGIAELESQVRAKLENALKQKEKEIVAQFEKNPDSQIYFNTEFRLIFFVVRSGVAAGEMDREFKGVELVNATVSLEPEDKEGKVTKENVGCGADQMEYHPLHFSEPLPLAELFEQSESAG